LANEFEVLLLDEPKASLDQAAVHHVEELLVRLAAETDLTFVFVTHDLARTRRLRDQACSSSTAESSSGVRCPISSPARATKPRRSSSPADWGLIPMKTAYGPRGRRRSRPAGRRRRP
jgi:ABC-type nitrate/sulfonate/bicarbonate transport system ATPase subunit